MTEDYELKVKLHEETMNDIEAVKRKNRLSDEQIIPYLLRNEVLQEWDTINKKEAERIRQRDNMNDIELMHYLLGLDKLLEMDSMCQCERQHQIDKAWMSRETF
jgi:hypothetical protein